MINTFLYPEKIRFFEREIIDFVVESGKNKRTSDIESHILAYFFLHPILTQNRIQELSGVFRSKKISIGSISNFVSKYEKYGIIVKTQDPEKKGTFIYSLKNRDINALTSIGFDTGFDLIHNWVEYIQQKLHILLSFQQELYENSTNMIFIERLKEMQDFFLFHEALLKSVRSGKSDIKYIPNQINIEDKKKKIEKVDISQIEKEIIDFIQNNPLFIIDKAEYRPIFSYLMIYKRLTQSELKNLTRLSSGIISQGLNYFLMQQYIELDKIQGIRKRYYIMPSIAYSNYLKQYHRLIKIKELKQRIDQIYIKMTRQEMELKDLDGYEIVRDWAKQTLKSFDFVEFLIKMFEMALDYFNPHKILDKS